VTEPTSRYVLSMDSSTAHGSVAVGSGEGVLAEAGFHVRGGHSAALLPAVDFVMRGAGLEPGDLAALVVGGGPGSFTGLRIAGATAKGMAHALGIPLFSYSGLLAAAAQAWSAPGPVCALFDARGRDVFAACYRFGAGVEVVLAPVAISLDHLLERLGAGDPGFPEDAGDPGDPGDPATAVPGGTPSVFVGDGALRHRDELEARGWRVAPSHFSAPRAVALLWLHATVPEMGRVPDAAAWEPDYLRASGAERIAAARAGDGGTPP
jgi:tRNA threonylcarbamoyladenosine biosynthesis protein TsaB